MLQRSIRMVDFIERCLLWPTKQPPTGPNQLNEIKHEGFGIIARQDGRGVCDAILTTDFVDRFLRIVEADASLAVQSCFIRGEAIVVDAA